MRLFLIIIITLIINRMIIIVSRMHYARRYQIDCRLYFPRMRVIYEPVSFGKASATKVLRLMEIGIHLIAIMSITLLILGYLLNKEVMIIVSLTDILYLLLFHWNEIIRLIQLRWKRRKVRHKHDYSFAAVTDLKLATFYVGFPEYHDYMLQGEGNTVIRYRFVDQHDNFLAICSVTKSIVSTGECTPVERYHFDFSLADIYDWKRLTLSGNRWH